MSAKEKIFYLNATIWFNLFIGIYNIYIYIMLGSMFHITLGALNIGVWVFNRHRLVSIFKRFRVLQTKKK